MDNTLSKIKADIRGQRIYIQIRQNAIFSDYTDTIANSIFVSIINFLFIFVFNIIRYSINYSTESKYSPFYLFFISISIISIIYFIGRYIEYNNSKEFNQKNINLSQKYIKLSKDELRKYLSQNKCTTIFV